MASSSDTSNGEAIRKRQNRGPPVALLVPLIYAPILPLIRIGLRHKPVLRDRLFFGVLAGAFAHGTYLVFASSYLTTSRKILQPYVGSALWRILSSVKAQCRHLSICWN